MNPLDETGALLVGLEIIQEQQWQTARLQAGTSTRLELVLDALQQQPAWWAPADHFVPALSRYQREQILRKTKQPAPSALRARLRLNDFLLVDLLGKGGMAVVYKAWDLHLHKFVAVKRMRKDLPILRKRFQREIELMRRLHHPAIAAFLGSGTAHGSALLVMEYLNGPTLRDDVAARHPVPWREVVGWFLPLLDALEHAHKHGIIHRDIKPGNVILHRESKGPVQPKLLDMGLARSVEGATAMRGQRGGESMTQAGQLIGTVDYMPPEQWAGSDRAVPESDLYALGGTLYYALTGKPPFGKGGPGQVATLCTAHANSPAPSVRVARPDVPDLLDLLIQQMLSKTPARRGNPSNLRPQFVQLHRMTQTSTATLPPPTGRSSPGASGSLPVPAAPRKEEKPGEQQAKGWGKLEKEDPALTVTPAPVLDTPSARRPAVVKPPSVIHANSSSALGRMALALLLGSAEWLLSLGMPWRYPFRFLLTLAAVAGALKYFRVW
jgi:serine/threonine protein kinase